MILQAWLFSAKRAWQEPYVKVLTCLVFSLMLGGVSYFLWKMLPRVGVVPSFVLHTNLYLGIDNVGSWRWLFLLPTVWVSVTVLDLLLAFGWFRSDAAAAGVLLAFAAGWSLMWVLFLYHLALLNV
jgi:hypothetical protein